MSQPATADRQNPVHTPIFDELHTALEALRRQPAHLRDIAAERLAEARRWCDLGEFKRALTELSHLTSELTTDGFFAVRPAKREEQWASEEAVVSFSAAS